MRFRWMAVPLALLLAGTALAADAPALKDGKEKISYGIGMDIGNNLKRQMIEVDPEVLAAGLRDAYSGSATRMTETEARETLMAFQKELQAKQAEHMKKMAEKNKEEGEKFLAENGKKKGVVTLESGLQYKVVKKGDGPTPKVTDTVEVNYRGTLIDGKEFDSSYKRGQPATFVVNQVIPGWTEALQKMKVGDKWELYIPSKLGYGERGAGRDIGPNATLLFEVELLGVK